jgi:hypothetical protein
VRQGEVAVGDEGLDGGDRKLGVVGALTFGITLDFGEVGKQPPSVGYLVGPETFVRSTQSIARRTTQQAAENALSQIDLATGHGRFSNFKTRASSASTRKRKWSGKRKGPRSILDLVCPETTLAPFLFSVPSNR